MEDNRHIAKCLNSACQHIFVRKWWKHVRCPRCKNAPCGIVRRGDISSWPLKEAKKIAACMREARISNLS